MPICPYCNQDIGSGLHNHIKACAKHPGEIALRRELAFGNSPTAIGRKYGVHHKTARLWIQELSDLPDSHLHPGLAPMYKKMKNKGGRRSIIENICDKCPALAYCKTTLDYMGWILCEAPSDTNLQVWAHRGIDIHQILADLKTQAPHLFTARPWESISTTVGARSPRPRSPRPKEQTHAPQ